MTATDAETHPTIHRAQQVSTSILIAEKEIGAASPLERELHVNGYTTIVARGGPQTVSLGYDDRFDLVILNLGFPDSGSHVVLRTLRTLRAAGATAPIIVLGTDSADAVAVLESGADDFMANPYRVEELLARIRARLRPTQPPTQDTLTAGQLRLDRLSRRCTIGDLEVELTTREFDLADALMRHPNQVLTRDQLLAQLWGPGVDSGSNIIDVYIGYLRRKLRTDIIQTIRGVGYRLAA